MDNRINNQADRLQLYIAKISTGWAILRKGKVIYAFDSEQELYKFWEDNAITIEGEYYELAIKTPPFPKIGEVFFELKWYEYLLKENFIVGNEKNKIYLTTKTANTIAVFESKMEFEKWKLIFDEWLNRKRGKISALKNNVKQKTKTKKKGKSPGHISSVKLEASKENSYRKNFIATDEYRLMKRDSDWWREQS